MNSNRLTASTLFFLFGFFIDISICDGEKPQADLILLGGAIATMDEAIESAEAIAIKDGRILFVGNDGAAEQFAGPRTRQIQLNGQFVMPGFIEGHAHFLGLGESLMMLNLAEARSWEEIVDMVGDAAQQKSPGEWIIGRGWHQSKWARKPEPNTDGYPTADALSAVTPNHPVLLTHASGHMSIANAYAMRLAGINEATRNPAGGEILRDDSGAATGVFRETAEALIERARAKDVAKQSAADRASFWHQAIDLATKECWRNGITSFQDAGTSYQDLKWLKEAADENRLGVRLWVMIRDSNQSHRQWLKQSKVIGYADDFYTVRAVKRSIDGALGPHGAWLLAPYSDMPTSTGLNTAEVDSVIETAELAAQHGFQVCVHAIGDRANREVLDLYEMLLAKYPAAVPRRWRIEHAQHLHPDDIPRFSRMGVIASMQGIHCTSDAIFVPQRLGMKRSAEGAYVWQSLLKAGVVVTNGTDAPVEPIDPLASFYASVTRRIAKDVTFFPEQKMTRMQALRSYTIDCAYAAFEESLKGSLVPGKLADLVVLNNDLRTCDEEAILNTKVMHTMVGGKFVYSDSER